MTEHPSPPKAGHGGKEEEQDGGKGLHQNWNSLFYSLAATFLLAKAAFLLVFNDQIPQTDPNEMRWRWALLGTSTGGCLLQYVLLQMSIKSGFKRVLKAGSKRKSGLVRGAAKARNAAAESLLHNDAAATVHSIGGQDLEVGRDKEEGLGEEKEEDSSGNLEKKIKALGKKKKVIWRLFALTFIGEVNV